MNKAYIYLPVSLIVILSIVYISLSVPSFSLLLHFMRLIYLAIPLSLFTGLFFYFKYRNEMNFDNLYVLVGSSVLFSFVIYFAGITYINRQYTTKNCKISSYEVVSYRGRMASGYGKLEKGEIKANQWVLTILKDEKKKTFVLDKDITHGVGVTNEMYLMFCKGLMGTEYLNVEH